MNVRWEEKTFHSNRTKFAFSDKLLILLYCSMLTGDVERTAEAIRGN